MKLQQPFKGYFRISQEFGENFNNWYKDDGLLGHQGIDFAMPTGTEIFSPVDGIVSGLSLDIQKGEGVSVMSNDIFQWNGQDCKLICVMWHLKDKSILVGLNDKVTKGQLLGLSDNTGQSTGSHLHFSIIPIATDGSRRPLAGYGNGYKGNVNPLLFLDFEPAPISQKETKIKELQTLLNKWGAKLVVDGKWGKLSTRALQDFLK